MPVPSAAAVVQPPAALPAPAKIGADESAHRIEEPPGQLLDLVPLSRFAGEEASEASAGPVAAPVAPAAGFAGAAWTGTPAIPAFAAARWTACALVSGRPGPALCAAGRGGTRTEGLGGPPGAAPPAGAGPATGGPALSGTTGIACRCTGTGTASAGRGAAGGWGRTTGGRRAGPGCMAWRVAGPDV
ncbi:hypothetical protein GTW37_24585 [Streptomyces sp. SID4931]|nr:hypothetical protein [Streptomyces sp. SID4931]